MTKREHEYDVIIVGGGPAGLSAALLLGRCRRRVLVCDEGKPRNRYARAMHGYLSRDGLNPLKLLELGRAELRAYGVEFRKQVVVSAICRNDHLFLCELADGTKLRSRKLLLATGVVDALPAIEGLSEMYGISVHHCPYCDGWEWRDKALAVYGRGKLGLAVALKLKIWSDDVALITDGAARLNKAQRRRLAEQNIQLVEKPVARLRGIGGRLSNIIFQDGSSLPRRAMFFSTGQGQRSNLAARLGCKFTRKNSVKTDARQRTSVNGLYLAGDASRDVQFVIVAAAEGAAAAVAINAELMQEEGLAIEQ